MKCGRVVIIDEQDENKNKFLNCTKQSAFKNSMKVLVLKPDKIQIPGRTKYEIFMDKIRIYLDFFESLIPTEDEGGYTYTDIDDDGMYLLVDTNTLILDAPVPHTSGKIVISYEQCRQYPQSWMFESVVTPLMRTYYNSYDIVNLGCMYGHYTKLHNFFKRILKYSVNNNGFLAVDEKFIFHQHMDKFEDLVVVEDYFYNFTERSLWAYTFPCENKLTFEDASDLKSSFYCIHGINGADITKMCKVLGIKYDKSIENKTSYERGSKECNRFCKWVYTMGEWLGSKVYEKGKYIVEQIGENDKFNEFLFGEMFEEKED